MIALCRYLLCGILTCQVGLVFFSVIMRYFLQRPLAWSDELATFMLVYVTFIGAYVAANTGHLARVELFVNLLPKGVQRAVNLLGRLCSAGLVGWIGVFGTKMYFSNMIQNQVSSAMRLPMRLVWWILPVTMFLLLFSELMGILHIFIPREDGNVYVPLD